MPSLALAMIVYNAARTLHACLDSVQDLVQEIQLIDTGSQDQSIQIARQFGAQVASFDWCDNFSAARNASIAGLQSDWILILDADECVLPSSRVYLQHVLQSLSGSQDPLILNGTQQTPGRPNLSKRCLFRNHQGLKFVGRVHEQLKGSRQAYTLEIPEFVIAHQPIDNAEKSRSYLHLIQLELSETTQPLRQAELYYHQSRSQQALGEPLAAMTALQQAYQLLLPAALPHQHGYDFYLQVHLRLLFAHLNGGQMTEAYSLALAFQARAPERPEGWFYQAYTGYWLDKVLDYAKLIQQARQYGFPALNGNVLTVRWQLRAGYFEQARQHLQGLPPDHDEVRWLWLYVYLLSNQHKQARALWQKIDPTAFEPKRILGLPYWSPQERRALKQALARYETDRVDHNSKS